jgi:hypothetical protein
MNLVMTLVASGDPDILDAQIAFHLSAGIDVVIATDQGTHDGTGEVLDAYASTGYLHTVAVQGGTQESELRARLARVAAADFRADWIFEAGAREFWWPRSTSLKDVLAPVPARYNVINALARVFEYGVKEDGFFAEYMTLRSTDHASGVAAQSISDELSPVCRPETASGVEGGWRVPLRAWYPIEVFRFPPTGRQRPNDGVARSVADGSVVVDERLRDALRALRVPTVAASARRFLVPSEAPGDIGLRIPSVVEDAAYAIDCAAVGEVDIAGLITHVTELESRVVQLEGRLMPSFRRRLTRLASRVKRP